MRTIESNGIKIYELSKNSAIPEFLGKRRQQNLKAKYQKITSQLDIIYDLTMPDVTTCISLSPDGKFLFLLGAYSPRVRCYELEQLSMKFERNADELPTKIAHIEKDYSKFVILEGEKTLSFHAAGGIHQKVPCENVIKDLIYSPFKNRLFLPDSKGIISVLDIERGYLSNKIINSNNLSSSFNCGVYNEITDMFFTGNNNGFMYGYDCRTGKRISSIDLRKAPISEYMKRSYVPEVCKLAFKDPLKIGSGTDKGQFHLYDIRNNSKPFSSRDLDYEFPIKSIIFHNELVISAVKCVFKIWEPIESEEGKIIATYDTMSDINDLCQYPNSGVLFVASNVPQIGTYFIPQIADAPPWCQQLSNLIVDVETESQSMYDTHTFITREEVDELNLVGEIGTSTLRAYMHGFYVSKETYKRTKNAMAAASAAAVARSKQDALLSTKESQIAKETDGHDPLDDIPDPRINVALKPLIRDKRFSDVFTCDAFILDPTCKAYEQAIVNMKHLARKRNKKLLLKQQAKKSKMMIDNVSQEAIEAMDDVIAEDNASDVIGCEGDNVDIDCMDDVIDIDNEESTVIGDEDNIIDVEDVIDKAIVIGSDGNIVDCMDDATCNNDTIGADNDDGTVIDHEDNVTEEDNVTDEDNKDNIISDEENITDGEDVTDKANNKAIIIGSEGNLVVCVDDVIGNNYAIGADNDDGTVIDHEDNNTGVYDVTDEDYIIGGEGNIIDCMNDVTDNKNDVIGDDKDDCTVIDNEDNVTDVDDITTIDGNEVIGNDFMVVDESEEDVSESYDDTPTMDDNINTICVENDVIHNNSEFMKDNDDVIRIYNVIESDNDASVVNYDHITNNNDIIVIDDGDENDVIVIDDDDSNDISCD